MMVPQFEEVLFETAVGEISDIVETQFGFHILQVMDGEEARPASLEEASDTIRELLIHDTRGMTVAQYVDELKQAADISME
jgi:parvulin-like peptidyl-prolyl isomerase